MMQRIEVEALSTATNAPVLKTPGRAFPGVLIQGDSLRILQSLIHQIYAHLVSDSTIDGHESEYTPLEIAEEMKELLDGYVAMYEMTLANHGYPLPYHKA